MARTALFLIPLAALAFSCKKNQLDGNATIKGVVSHHSKPIPYARVFVKFNAKEFPGTDTTLYDARIVSDAGANFSFACYKGDYYLFGYGYDTGINKVVYDGVPIHIRAKEVVNTTVPVTEDH